MNKLKIAVIGCGAIAEKVHLPVIAHSHQVDIIALVDRLLPCAHHLADLYAVPNVTDDYRKIIDKVDVAIITLPHHLHAPVAIDLLQHGIHILVEKPMAMNASDCDEMIKEACNAKVTLAVGMVCRFYRSSQFIKQLIQKGLLGNIKSFDIRQGSIYGWPVVDASMFQKATGGGVLTGIGSHALDLLLWWLGDWESLEYYDDAYGGVEADCEVHLTLKSGTTGVAEFSRTRKLRNTYVIHGDQGSLELGTDPDPSLHLTITDQDGILSGRILQPGDYSNTFMEAIQRQFEDFLDAVIKHRQPFVPGQEGQRVVELIEHCEAVRKALRPTWMFSQKATPNPLET